MNGSIDLDQALQNKNRNQIVSAIQRYGFKDQSQACKVIRLACKKQDMPLLEAVALADQSYLSNTYQKWNHDEHKHYKYIPFLEKHLGRYGDDA